MHRNSSKHKSSHKAITKIINNLQNPSTLTMLNKSSESSIRQISNLRSTAQSNAQIVDPNAVVNRLYVPVLQKNLKDVMQERASKYYDRTPGPYEYFQNQQSDTNLELLGTHPRQFGKEQKCNSETVNAPKFSLRGRNFEKKEKQLIVSDNNEVITQMAVCRHSPGVGRYDLK